MTTISVGFALQQVLLHNWKKNEFSHQTHLHSGSHQLTWISMSTSGNLSVPSTQIVHSTTNLFSRYPVYGAWRHALYCSPEVGGLKKSVLLGFHLFFHSWWSSWNRWCEVPFRQWEKSLVTRVWEVFVLQTAVLHLLLLLHVNFLLILDHKEKKLMYSMHLRLLNQSVLIKIPRNPFHIKSIIDLKVVFQ